MAQKVYVICTDQERGKHLAWFDIQPAMQSESFISAEEAIGKLMLLAADDWGSPPIEVVNMDHSKVKK